MREWQRTHYDPNGMGLCVVANMDIPTLSQWVTELFSDIPKPNLSSAKSEPNERVEWVTQTPLEVKWKPLTELRRVQMLWQIPVKRPHWRAPPTSLLSFLLGHEGDPYL